VTDSDNARTPAIEENLVLVGLQAPTAEDVIRALSDRLYRAGYVDEGFAKAVAERERTFPTGLPTEIPVAIPHTEPQHCHRPAIAVGLLEKPVPFGLMGTDDQTVQTQVVFLLAITDPKLQVQWLRRLVEFFQRPGLLREIQSVPSAADVAHILRRHLLSQRGGDGAKE